MYSYMDTSFFDAQDRPGPDISSPFTYGDPGDRFPGDHPKSLRRMMRMETKETVGTQKEASKGTTVVKEMELNGCHVKLIFAEEPVDGVIERIQEILSYDHSESSEKLNKPV